MDTDLNISVESPNARADAINRARLLLLQRPVYLDTETTGFEKWDEIAEISVIDQDGGTLFQSRIKPTISIPPDAARYHGITDADVASSPSFGEAWPGLLRALSGRHICAYNANYDMRMLRQSLAAHGIAGWTPQAALHHCIMLLFAAFYGERDAYHGNYRYKKLSFAADYFGLPPWQEHGSLADAQAVRLVLQKMAECEI
jgi:DNA polymerase-3 subunit epsilon